MNVEELHAFIGKCLNVTSTITWHETASDPPPEDGVYLGWWLIGEEICTAFYTQKSRHGLNWSNLEGSQMWYDPDFWAELPAPPTKGE